MTKNNMMKKFTYILFLLLSFNSVAQNNSKTLLNEVSEKIKSYDNISISFKYTLENDAEDIKQETHGDVILYGDKYRLNILGITRLVHILWIRILLLWQQRFWVGFS